ncbi:PTS fructose transporter subunit IIB [Photobacterium iliopiscarium]|uniref:PTS fructose transporter subunit IIB n=1 Tax=Photobacterium iliopiscarium TaxID=56192 RepID=UPI001E4248A9|nr:PTS fructose transporter subunit IIB [Photobacterium iliopiscarium]MCD9467789.1 PTS fructose transporter subunit IIB [Photobacterium iliopiscarium]
MKIVAVTACPTGIAHTYMAADVLNKTAHQMGIEHFLTAKNIACADIVLIASDIEVEQRARFTGSRIHCVTIEEVLVDAIAVIERCQQLCQ